MVDEAGKSQDSGTSKPGKWHKFKQSARNYNQYDWQKEKRQAKAIGSGTKAVAVGSLSYLIVILGFFHYLLRVYSFDPSITLITSLILFVLGGYTLSQRLGKDRLAIWLPMLIFVMWYFVFDSSVEISFLLYFIPVAAIILFLPGFLTKGESAMPELVGLIPVVFLFLDIGLLPLLVEQFSLPITPLMENLVLFMPWWMLFGLFSLPGDVSENHGINLTVNILRVAAVAYIIFIFVAPAIPDVGYQDSLLPEAGEFEAAQQRLRERLPQRENPFISNIACIFSGQYSGVQECVKERQLKSEIKNICEELEGIDPKESPVRYRECLKEEEEKKRNPSGQVAGVIDRTIKEPTTAKLTIETTNVYDIGDTPIPFVAELEIKNPRKQIISAEVTCKFEGRQGKEDVQGRIEGPAGGFKDDFQGTYLCYAEPGTEKFEGNYIIHYEAILRNLETKSRLQRAFIGDISPEEKEKLRREEISKVIRVTDSQGPADLAVLNFDIGHAAGEVIIEDKEYRNILLRSKIENLGGGKILRVKNYFINLPSAGMSVQADSSTFCMQGVVEDATKFKREIPLPTCVIDENYDPNLKNPVLGWLPFEFEATLNYDYQITAKKNLKVTLQS